MNTIFILLLVGFALLFAELFLPGMIAGIIGALCLLAATVMMFIQEGPEAGIYLLIGELVFSMIGFTAWMKYFPETRFGKKFILPEDSNSSPLPPQWIDLLHQTGRSLTALRPSGTIEIHGSRYDAVSENQFIEPGEPVQVVKLNGAIIVVRKIQST